MAGSVSTSAMSSFGSFGTGTYKPVDQMSDAEFADYAANAQKNKSRADQLANINSNASSVQQQAKDMAQVQLDNADKQMAMSAKYRSAEKTQDDSITRGQADQNYGFQRGLADQGYNNQRGLNDQSYNNQRGLADQSYGFQRGLNDQQNTQQTSMQSAQFGQQKDMFNMQDAAKSRDTQSARQAANALYFGRSRNRGGFQGRMR